MYLGPPGANIVSGSQDNFPPCKNCNTQN